MADMIALLLLVAMVSQEAVGEPERCCESTLGTAKISQVFSMGLTAPYTTAKHEGTIYTDYTDPKAYKLAMDIWTRDRDSGNKTKMMVVRVGMVQYTYLPAYKQCYKMEFTHPLMPCIHPGAVYEGERTIGNGEDSLKLNVWKMESSDYGVDMSMVYTQSCTLVQIYGRYVEGVPTMLYHTRYDHQPTVTDPAVFDIPEACNHAIPAPKTARQMSNSGAGLLGNLLVLSGAAMLSVLVGVFYM